MGLDQQLAGSRSEVVRTATAGRAARYEAKIEELRASFAAGDAVGVGDRVPGALTPVRPTRAIRACPSPCGWRS